MKQKSIFQHEPLRIPQGWADQQRMLVIQMNRLLDDIYNKLGEVHEIQDRLETFVDKSSIKDNLTTTDAGSVLDARQGKELFDLIELRAYGKRMTKPMPANTNQCIVDFPSGMFLVSMSMPGISRAWLGLVYVAGNGTVTIEKVNNSSSIEATAGTNSVTFTFTYTSDTNIHMTALPLRSNTFPSFH